MKEFYYVSTYSLNKWGGGGVSYKIIKQIEAFKKEGYLTKFIHLQDDNLSTKLNKLSSYFIPLKNNGNDYSKLNCISSGAIVYLRYSTASSGLVRSLKKLKERGCICLIEIPTYPYEKQCIGSSYLRGKILIFRDIYYRRHLKKYVHRILTYSDDNEIFGVPTLNISNFIDTTTTLPRYPEKHDSINLIAVANMSFWHGYDRIINGLIDYYRKPQHRIVKLHLIGGGNIVKRYKKLVYKNNISEHVIFHGPKYGKNLDLLYNIADIGLDALARHRSGIVYNSTLKGKEYMAKGLPILSGVKTELDSDNNFPYYLRIPANETPVDIDCIVTFFDSVYGNSEINRVINNIREYAIQNFDIKVTFSPVIETAKNYQKILNKKCLNDDR